MWAFDFWRFGSLFNGKSRAMNTPHPRNPSIIRRPHLGTIPKATEKALDRRHELDARQRAFRSDATTPHEPARLRPRPPG
jgi:hypothetical protein